MRDTPWQTMPDRIHCAGHTNVVKQGSVMTKISTRFDEKAANRYFVASAGVAKTKKPNLNYSSRSHRNDIHLPEKELRIHA
jgi:hypothetical protein